jgi:hypothetical protein
MIQVERNLSFFLIILLRSDGLTNDTNLDLEHDERSNPGHLRIIIWKKIGIHNVRANRICYNTCLSLIPADG